MVIKLIELERGDVSKGCNLPIRVEFQIAPNSKLLSAVKTMGELRKKFSELDFVKYIYLDPQDNLLKGINPLNDIPLVSKAYITVAGEIKDIIKFSKLATSR